MDINICFDLVAFMIVVVTIIYFGAKRKMSLPLYKIYSSMLIVLIGGITVNMLAVLYSYFPDLASVNIRLAINLLRTALNYSLPVLYTMYVLTNMRMDERITLGWKLLIYFPYVVSMVVLSCIAIGEVRAGASETSYYVNPVAVIVLTSTCIYYLLVIVIICVYYSGRVSLRIVANMILVGVGIPALEMLQMAYPERRFFAFCMALIMVDMVFSIQRPEEIFDATDALQRKYLQGAVRQGLNYNKPFFLVFIKINDYHMIVDSLGQDDAEGYIRNVNFWLAGKCEDALVYRVEKDIIVLKTGKVSEAEQKALLDSIERRFREAWRMGVLETFLSVSIIPARCPQEVTDMEMFRRLVRNIEKMDLQPGVINNVSKLIADDDEMKILTAIRRGLENNSFQVYYQPIYSTEKKRITAAEALIRLNDPEYGFISPEPMIALAEREGYILRIGEIVFTQVCRFYSENNLAEMGIEYIEVNLSAVQCMKSRLSEEFMSIMRDFDIPANAINFEITETAAMTANSEVNRNISSFQDQGVSLSLDDYGTGYSNISYLYNMPFILMKIDKSLLWSADDNEKANITLKNTFRMAQKLRMHVVMEGVETDAHVRKLLSLNCDYFQGYYFSKAINDKEFIEYIKNFKVPEVCQNWTR